MEIIAWFVKSGSRLSRSFSLEGYTNRSTARKFLDVVKLSFCIYKLVIMMPQAVCCQVSNERQCHTADLPSELCLTRLPWT